MKYLKFTAFVLLFSGTGLFSMDEISTSNSSGRHSASNIDLFQDKIALTQDTLTSDNIDQRNTQNVAEKNARLILLKNVLNKSLKDRQRVCGIPEWLKKYSNNVVSWFCSKFYSKKKYLGENLSNDQIAQVLNLATLKENKKKKFKFLPTIPVKTFTNLAGEIPLDIQDIVNSIKRAMTKGEKTQRKILLYGPAGTGKSSLAEAIAGELNWDFYNVISSTLITKYQGSSQKLMNKLFTAAGNSNKGAVVFIDEIDGIANEKTAESNGEINRAIASLHSAIDSLGLNNKNIICIVATNFIERIPDTIKSRFGSNLIGVNIPEADKRAQILNTNLSDYVLGDDYIHQLTDLSEGFSCRDLYNLIVKAKDMAPDLFEKTEENNEQRRTKLQEILKVALYRVQEKVTPGPEDLKIVFRYYLEKLLHNKTAEELNDFIENQAREVLTEMQGLTGKEIHEIITIANSLKNGELTALDLFVGIFYDNSKKLPSFIKRKKILDYFIKKYGAETIDDLWLNRIATDLDGFSGKGIKQLCILRNEFMKMNLSRSFNRQEPTHNILNISKFYAALCQTLEKKAVPFKVIEHFSKNPQFIPVGSASSSIGTLGAAFNIPAHYRIEYPGFLIEKIFLKDFKDFQNEFLISNNDEKRVRLEMLNVNSPSSSFVFCLILYNLDLHNMNIAQSGVNLLKSPYLAKLVFLANISCTTIKNIIVSTIEFAKDANRDICLESDLLKALKELNFSIKGYQHLSLPDKKNEDYQEFKRVLNSFLSVLAQMINPNSGYCSVM